MKNLFFYKLIVCISSFHSFLAVYGFVVGNKQSQVCLELCLNDNFKLNFNLWHNRPKRRQYFNLLPIVFLSTGRLHLVRIMQDLETAKKQLYNQKLTLVIVKNDIIIFQTDSHRISGFIGAIEKFGTQLKDASVADRVAGKAIALLCVYAGIRQVYAEVLSRKAQAVFEDNKILFSWKEIIDNVLDLNKAGVCPFEKIAAEISNPNESYAAFKALLEKMNPCS